MRRQLEFAPLWSSSSHYSPFDLAVLLLVALHLLLSLAAAIFVLQFHLRSSLFPRRRLRLLLCLNSLWPVRLLLLLFASLLSSSELLRLPVLFVPSRRPHWLCAAYNISSQSFAQPAFLATLLFLLRASTHSVSSNRSAPLSFASALAAAIATAFPFALLHFLFLFLVPVALRNLSLPPDLLTPANDDPDRCSPPLYAILLLALLAAVYVPLFISACWSAVTVVINKRLRIRLYALAAVVVLSLCTQVTTLAVSSLWSPGDDAAQGLSLLAFFADLTCVVVGEGILVVQPVVDALAVVNQPEKPSLLDLPLADAAEDGVQAEV